MTGADVTGADVTGTGATAAGVTAPGPADPAGRAAELRRAFDRSFAEPPPPPPPPSRDLLAVRAAGRPYALALSEIAGLFPAGTLAPLPGAPPELIGLAGLRGAILPVYDLGALLGHGPGGSPRWLAVAAGRPRIALAFEALDGHRRVAADAIARGGDAPARHLQGALRGPDGVRPLIDVPSLIHEVAARAGPARPSTEGG